MENFRGHTVVAPKGPSLLPFELGNVVNISEYEQKIMWQAAAEVKPVLNHIEKLDKDDASWDIFD